MKGPFQRIGLFAKHNDSSVADTFKKLITFLVKRGHILTVEAQSATLLSKSSLSVVSREDLGKASDLIIVMGGDGSLLNAARAVVPFKVPVLGINRGRLGFLVDILPENVERELGMILDGIYTEEKRFLLEASIKRQGKPINQSIALNDIVLYSGSVARMIDFEIYINDHFVLRQEADGIITATPTGSTAYALSAGGPILHPTLNALTIVPLCPHTLSSRPIVVEDKSHIKLIVTKNNEISPKLSFDSQLHYDLSPGDEIFIQKYQFDLHLIHPKEHEYFSVLREKLAWGARYAKD